MTKMKKSILHHFSQIIDEKLGNGQPVNQNQNEKQPKTKPPQSEVAEIKADIKSMKE